MRDDDSESGGIGQYFSVGCAGVLVAIALAVGLFFGICSMFRR